MSRPQRALCTVTLILPVVISLAASSASARNGPRAADRPVSIDWTVEGDSAAAWFGYAVATAGDVNGDGYSDVIVGARHFTGSTGVEAGQARLYLGSPGGLRTVPAWVMEGTDVGDVAPPLVIRKEQLDSCLDILDESVSKVESSR